MTKAITAPGTAGRFAEAMDEADAWTLVRTSRKTAMSRPARSPRPTAAHGFEQGHRRSDEHRPARRAASAQVEHQSASAPNSTAAVPALPIPNKPKAPALTYRGLAAEGSEDHRERARVAVREEAFKIARNERS
ncbi:hypothetical protein [Thermomonospora amylolytica]|uniref:hypothetical protein n=1 Tax=Thermomonospora amylolytica TaxID=1411117 RepID=UPI0013008469|nr:hypothetical protein [Thermomonospora amylolytica]